jgi:hypothetical protein
MDPTLIVGITSLSAIGLGILTKIVLLLRSNVKNCWGIQFRSPVVNSPRSTEISAVREHFDNTLNIRPTQQEKIDKINDTIRQMNIHTVRQMVDEDKDVVYI